MFAIGETSSTLFFCCLYDHKTGNLATMKKNKYTTQAKVTWHNN